MKTTLKKCTMTSWRNKMKCDICHKEIKGKPIINKDTESIDYDIEFEVKKYLCSKECLIIHELTKHEHLMYADTKEDISNIVNHLIKYHNFKPKDIEKALNNQNFKYLFEVLLPD